MKLLSSLALILPLTCTPLILSAAPPQALDQMLQSENQAKGVDQQPLPLVDDLAYLRRVTIDLIGRIPTREEVEEYQSWPEETRRQKKVDQLLQDVRFADRWTIFYADMLRLRSGSEGGSRLIAFVHYAIESGMPYDELAYRLIATNGKVGNTPEVGFVLGDNADPMALAGSVSQTFLGIRIACAQCHDHPFDVWTREDFYGFAAYFGKTRRVESRFNDQILAIYTTDVPQNTIMWPPEGDGDPSARKPMTPRFPFEIAAVDQQPEYIQRLTALRAKQKQPAEPVVQNEGPSVDDLLDGAEQTLDEQLNNKPKDQLGVLDEVKKDVKKLNIASGRYQDSELRSDLAEMITDPRNEFFSRNFANRVWAELLGTGFVNPVDDFNSGNPPSHPETLDYLAHEFVANGYDLKSLVRSIVLSEAYQREHAWDADEATRQELEAAYLATPVKRMISEVLYDSIIVAGHLFDVKHEAGKNMKTIWEQTRVMIAPSGQTPGVQPMNLAQSSPAMNKPAMGQPKMAPPSGYNLEKSIDQLDFDELLKSDEQAPVVEEMAVMSAEELEAMRMAQEMQRQQADYFDRFVRKEFDDNPKFTTAMRMASPAPPDHFLRIFGQTPRSELGEMRDQSPTMRQALMMLNGRLVNEAARVGELEPIHSLLTGEKASVDAAIDLAYLEILTRKPTADEVTWAKQFIAESPSSLDGMADLRWVLLNSNEFRFLP